MPSAEACPLVSCEAVLGHCCFAQACTEALRPWSLQDILTYARIKPAVHQIEVHPVWTNQYNIDYCMKEVLLLRYPSLHPCGPSSWSAASLPHAISITASNLILLWSKAHPGGQGYALPNMSLGEDCVMCIAWKGMTVV